MTKRRDIHERVTATIIEAMEKGAPDFQMPWHGAPGGAFQRPQNAITGRAYNGINITVLWAVAFSKGYGSNEWATFNQWKERGVKVRKGEKAAPVVFFKPIEVEPDPDNENDAGLRYVAKGYSVFNAEQVEGYEAPAIEQPNLVERIEKADQFIEQTGAEIVYEGTRAFYSPDNDQITMPKPAYFRDTEGSTATENFYAVQLHELIHWTGAQKRLNRLIPVKRFGDNVYAMEELVADLGAAMLCADLGIRNEPRPDHASYLQHWLDVLKQDKRAIFFAAAAAHKASEYLHDLQEGTQPAT